MPLRDLLAFVELPSEAAEAAGVTPALAQGLALAAGSEAKLTIVVSAPKVIAPYSPMYPGFAASLAADANEKAEKAADAMAEVARDAARRHGIPAEITAEVFDIDTAAHSAARRARRFDLVIVDQPAHPLDSRGAVFQAVLFQSGRPVMIAPRERPPSDRLRRLALAWDGSSHAARALADALALFAPPASIDVVTVTGEKDLSDALPGAEIAKHIARHGVETTLTNLAVQGRKVAELLEAHALASGADAILMGGYGHARWRQLLLGGVTLQLTQTSRVPLILDY